MKLSNKPYLKNWLDRCKKVEALFLGAWSALGLRGQINITFLIVFALKALALYGIVLLAVLGHEDKLETYAQLKYTVKNPPTPKLSLNVDNIFDEKTLKFTHFECSLAPPSVIYVLKSDFAVDGDDLLSLFQVRNSSCPDSPDFIFNASEKIMAHFIEKDTAAYTHRMDLDRIARIELGYGEN